MHLVALTKFNPPKGPRTHGSTQQQRDKSTSTSYNSSTSAQIRRKLHTEKVTLFFHPSVPKPFAFHCPVPALETAINCPCLPSRGNYSQLRDLHPCGAVSPKEDERGREGASWAAATDLLKVVDVLGTVSRQDKRCILCYHHIILNAHTNATKPLRSTHIILRDINAWKKKGN